MAEENDVYGSIYQNLIDAGGFLELSIDDKYQGGIASTNFDGSW